MVKMTDHKTPLITAQGFHTYVNNSDTLGLIDEQVLCRAVEEYPYCGSLHSLLAKSLHNQQSSLFAKQLPSSAMHAANLEALYALIHPEEKQNSFLEMALPVVVKKEHLELLKPVSSMQPEQPELKAMPEASKLPDSKAKKSFLAWLQDFPQGTAVLHAPVQSTAIEKQAQKNSLLPAIEKEQTPAEIINAFIGQTKPSFVSDQREEKSAEDQAAQSITPETNMVSETLAQIYVNQRLYHKAIAAYEQLSLKFPEKNTYFASLLKKIKALAATENT